MLLRIIRPAIEYNVICMQVYSPRVVALRGGSDSIDNGRKGTDSVAAGGQPWAGRTYCGSTGYQEKQRIDLADSRS